MDLSKKLQAAEVPASVPAIPVREIIEPARIVGAARVNTRFNHPAIKLEVTTSTGESRVTFLPARFVSLLTDEDLEEFTSQKKYYVKCTGMGARSPHVLIFKN